MSLSTALHDLSAQFWALETSVWSEFALIGIIIWLLRYLLMMVRPPALYHTPTLFNAKVISSTKGLNERFWPTVWLAHGWLQSLWSVIRWHRKPVNYERELLDVTPITPAFQPGQIALDWAIPTPKLKAKFRDADDEARSPITIIFHGLSGGSQEKYVLAMVNRLLNHSPCRVVVINARGCGGIRLKSPQAYSAGYTEDHRQAIAHIARRFPEAPLFGVGFSLGANIMAKLIGEDGAYCLLAGAVCIGTPYCLLRGISSLERTWWSRLLFSRVLAMNLANLFECEVPIFKGTHLEAAFGRLRSIRSISEFDNTITAPMFHYNSGDHYYGEASAQRYLPNIQRPLLFISSEDDPICKSDTIPYDECRSNPDIILAVTVCGGHSMDHFQGLRPQSWNAIIASQYFSSLLQHLPANRRTSQALLADALARGPAETASKLYHPLSLAHYMQPRAPHQAHPQHPLPQLDASFLADHQQRHSDHSNRTHGGSLMTMMSQTDLVHQLGLNVPTARNSMTSPRARSSLTMATNRRAAFIDSPSVTESLHSDSNASDHDIGDEIDDTDDDDDVDEMELESLVEDLIADQQRLSRTVAQAQELIA